MSRAQRLGFAALAAVIAVVAVVLLAGGSDDEPTASDRASAPAATETPASAPEEAEPQSTPTPKPEPKPEMFEYRRGKAVGGVKRLSVEKGGTARFSVASDVDEEIHVHGYDIVKDVQAGKPARFEFKADIEGIFEVEMHGSAVPVAQLRVEP